MLGLGGDDKDSQRFWNLIVFKMYATDDEIEDMMPIFGIIILLVIVGGLIYHFCK
jgi:hypothetical protein